MRPARNAGTAAPPAMPVRRRSAIACKMLRDMFDLSLTTRHTVEDAEGLMTNLMTARSPRVAIY